MKIKFLNLGVTSLMAIFILLGCASESPSNNSFDKEEIPVLTEEELKEQLKLTECSSPASYFEGTLKHSPKYKNALSIKVKALKIECAIKNTATLATFKDVKLHLTFKSKTGTNILEKDLTVFEFFSPGKTVNYKTEIEISNQEYQDISDFEWSIIDASCH